MNGKLITNERIFHYPMGGKIIQHPWRKSFEKVAPSPPPWEGSFCFPICVADLLSLWLFPKHLIKNNGCLEG